MSAKSHTITPTGDLLCGCNSFAAMARSGRDTCSRCDRALEDIMHAVDRLADLPGMSELCARDARVRRVVERLAGWRGGRQETETETDGLQLAKDTP